MLVVGNMLPRTMLSVEGCRIYDIMLEQWLLQDLSALFK